MDIYEMAKRLNSDYYDPKLGIIYRVEDYNYAIKNGLPTSGIRMFSITGNFIGVAKKSS